MTYDYYRDPTVSLHAFKAGEYDFREENISRAWATAYNGPPFDNGFIIKEEINNDVNQGMQCFVFNTRRSLFEDKKVRQALSYAFDFEWTNKNLFYGQYTRSTSFFSNSELASSGLPGREELAILEPYRDRLPPEVFEKEYQPPKTDGSGNIRNNIRIALRLLKQAGWAIKGKKLVNNNTGEAFKFEILLIDPAFERVILPFKRNLARLGIEMTIRVVDTAQFINRRRDYDFDMITARFVQSESPGNEQREYWGSSAADIAGTRNFGGIKNPIIDNLIELVISAPTREKLVYTTRALDRVLLWGHYVIPQWHIAIYRVAYWNKFSRPKIIPRYALGFDTWWIDPQKNAKLVDYKKHFKK
jgi:microcin C transport system substrate-binding protein